MKDRCYNSNSSSFKNYGGRGIKVCEKWLGKEGFKIFMDWAMQNGYKEEILPNGNNLLTLDRIDVNGDYEPSNCRWVTNAEQQNNKTNNKRFEYKGKIQNIMQWAKEYGLQFKTLELRLQRGWSIQDALEKPIMLNQHKAGIRKTNLSVHL